MKEKIYKIFNSIFEYRYWIAIIIFILCILFELSGSSIGIWNEIIQMGKPDEGVIIGTSRSIRSDEYAVFTPMMFSQKFDGFNYFSNLIRGGKTDVSLVYALPIMNFIQIFRPFQIGFLFLGLAKGLSFFWYGRFIALFLVMLELFMLITKKNKILSIIGATLITLAPIIQWWFAVNGIVEIFVFGGLAVILLDKYMKTKNFQKRCLYLFLLYICAGGYILVFYPAWQIPMFYVFLMLAIWVIIKNRKQCKMERKDFVSIGITAILFILTMVYILNNSLDTIKSITGTVYPGSRNELGGGAFMQFFQYPMNMFLPYKRKGILTNQCEIAVMFGLFPMGIIMTAIVFIKEKKKDVLLILLSVIYAFLAIWCIWGFPAFLAKLTLMNNSQGARAYLAIGMLDVIILLRALSLIKKPIKRLPAIIISVIVASIMVFLCEMQNKEYVTLEMCIIMVIVCIYLFYMILRYKAKYANYLLAFGIIIVMIMTGFRVNPIRTGVGVIYNNEIIKEIQRINKEENGKWIVEGLEFPMANYVLFAGVPVINSTNVYPDMEKWHKIDTESKYEEIYNRYAHINIKLENENDSEEKFRLIQADYFEVKLTLEELQKLEVKYIFTNNNLSQYNLEEIYNNNNYYIYKIKS